MWKKIQSSFGEGALKDFLFLSSVGLLQIVCQNIKAYLHWPIYNVFYSESEIQLHALYLIKKINKKHNNNNLDAGWLALC